MIIWYFLHGSKNKQKMSNIIVEGLLRDDEKWEWNLSEKTLVESLSFESIIHGLLTTDMVFWLLLRVMKTLKKFMNSQKLRCAQ